MTTEGIMNELRAERTRQDAKFGPIRDMDLCEWVCVLTEEIGEAAEAHADMLMAGLMDVMTAAGGRLAQAVHETVGERTDATRFGIDAVRKELVQVAAVAVNIIRHIDDGHIRA